MLAATVDVLVLARYRFVASLNSYNPSRSAICVSAARVCHRMELELQRTLKLNIGEPQKNEANTLRLTMAQLVPVEQ